MVPKALKTHLNLILNLRGKLVLEFGAAFSTLMFKWLDVAQAINLLDYIRSVLLTREEAEFRILDAMTCSMLENIVRNKDCRATLGISFTSLAWVFH